MTMKQAQKRLQSFVFFFLLVQKLTFRKTFPNRNYTYVKLGNQIDHLIHINFNIRIANKWTVKSMKRLCIYNILQSFRLPSEIFVLFVLIHENSFCRRLKNLKLNELTFWLSVFLTFYSYYYLYFIWYASFIERKQRASGGWKKVCPDTRAIKHINTERSNTQCVQLKCLNSSYIPFVPLNLKVNEEQKSSK